jgi:hypothetical protein
MTYFRPDEFNTTIIKWAVRLTIICIAIAVVSIAAAFAINALIVLGGTLFSLIHPIITAFTSADPLIQLSLELAVFLALLALGAKLFLAIMASQGIGRAIA